MAPEGEEKAEVNLYSNFFHQPDQLIRVVRKAWGVCAASFLCWKQRWWRMYPQPSSPPGTHSTHHICVIYYGDSNYAACVLVGEGGCGLLVHLKFSNILQIITQSCKSETHSLLASPLLWINVGVDGSAWVKEKDGNEAVLLLRSKGQNDGQNPPPLLKAVLLPSAGWWVEEAHTERSPFNLSPSHLEGIIVSARERACKDSRSPSPP